MSKWNKTQLKKLLIVFLICELAVLVFYAFFYFFSNQNYKDKLIVLEIQNLELVNRDKIIQVNQGDEITFRIVADKPDEFHLEGYHAFSKFEANTPKEVSIQALSAGVFPIKLDRSNTYLGVLKVIPTQRN